jgi:DNA-binding MarR family transcriptional regulator
MRNQISKEIATINQANARIINLYCEWVKSKGMNYNEFLIYYVLLEGNKTQKELSLRTHLIKQTVNNIVKTMLLDGYVILQDNPVDGREKYVVLTEKGNKKAHLVADELIEIENRVVEKMGKEVVQQLGNLSILFGNILEEEMK